MSTPVILGTALGGAAVGALTFTAVFGRLWRGMGAAAFFALFVSLFLANSIKDSYNASNAQNFTSAMNDELLPSASNAFAGKPTSLRPCRSLKATLEKLKGCSGRRSKVMLPFKRNMKQPWKPPGSWNCYRLSEFCATQTVPRQTRSSEQQVGRLRSSRDEQRRSMKFLGKVRALDLQNKNAKTSFVNGALKTAQETKQFNTKTWALENVTLRRQIAIANFLIANRGKWTADVDNIYFEDDAAIESYNNMQSQLTSAIEEHDALLRQRQQDFNSLQERYKKALATGSGGVPSSEH
ncbi:MAG: hypothetical protein IPO30_19410 [Hyphomonadaceae bacterium]|nr:hypothetical protein [Hyphomonadaceae bacterium]